MTGPATSGIPSFAVVGRVNMGKSAVIATLLEIDDNELIRVSPTPGETTRSHPYPVIFGGKECVRFIDTPGFSQPVEALRAIRALHVEGTPTLAALRRFVGEAGDDFADEKRLLEPLLEGAGVLYIVDPARPLRDDFLAEMEILRWTGRPRLALLNRRSGDAGPDEEAWRASLGANFNLVRTFDAHRARFNERLRLLGSLLEIEERHRGKLEETIRLVEGEWKERREEAAEVVIGFFEEALMLRAEATLEERDLTLPARRQKKAEMLERRYFESLERLEHGCFSRLLGIYRHHLLRAESNPESFTGIDLKSEEAWTKWGLSRAQLAVVSALTGGAAGLALDVATGFLSHGVFAALGGLGTGAAAWFKGGSLPDLRIDFKGGVKLATGEGYTLAMGPPKNPNFPWILLDGVLTRYQRMLARAHGRRDVEVLEGGEGGFTRNFPRERREVLAKWFASCLKGAPNRGLEPKVFAALVETLEEVG